MTGGPALSMVADSSYTDAAIATADAQKTDMIPSRADHTALRDHPLWADATGYGDWGGWGVMSPGTGREGGGAAEEDEPRRYVSTPTPVPTTAAMVPTIALTVLTEPAESAAKGSMHQR
jgi:hypothetical protein